MTQVTVNIIGAGGVGHTLMALLNGVPDIVVQDVLSARLLSAQAVVQAVGKGRAVKTCEDLRPADLWILSVPDTCIAEVATEVADSFRELETTGSVAFHCSGFFAADQMAPLRDLGWHLASVHPVLSFADPAAAVRSFPGTHCGIEGDEPALDVIRPLLTKIGAHPFPIKSESKSLYHAAAVISNNFTVVVQAIAREAWEEAGVPSETAEQLNEGLLRATCENVVANGPQGALTGPAARGDDFVVRQQGQDVANWHREAGGLYDTLSTMAKRLKAHGTTFRRS
jgi:predicted short-subunit dehydrogenase-like oxidoreductase (DUF2520 family)